MCLKYAATFQVCFVCKFADWPFDQPASFMIEIDVLSPKCFKLLAGVFACLLHFLLKFFF
jgi:hypothetical protein